MIGTLPPDQRTSFISSLTPREATLLIYDWSFWARPEQIPPNTGWATFLYLAGRGAGKTRAGAEWVRSQIERGRSMNIALVGATARDVRKTMVEGESGILAVCPPWFRPRYEPSKLMLTWPNGGQAHMYSAEEPERLRGPNHTAAWCDELGSWKYLEATWNNLEMTLRAGWSPRRYVTTTPKPRQLLRDLIADESTLVVRGTTYDNAVNLSPDYIQRVRQRYEGTRTGRQELYAELLEEAEGALWRRSDIDTTRVAAYPHLSRIVVAIDPAVTATAASDETGIVVAGMGVDSHVYVIRDLSGRYSPDGWARRAIGAYRELGADRIVGEVNNGGDMVLFTLRTIDDSISYKDVRASRGKAARAEPVAALFEQGRAHIVGTMPALEDQLVNWRPLGAERSPDRLDAMVWAVTELAIEEVHFAVQAPLGL